MSNTPTYEQLSALCAQMAAALEKALWLADPTGSYIAADPAHPEWANEGLAALTAYRTLSPDPVWQRVPEGCVVVPARPTPVWPQHELDALVQAYDRGRAKHGITETLMHVVVSWQKHWRARGEG